MCGIIAIASRTPIDATPLERGLRAMRHRGPDSSGIWLDAGGEVGLGHTRLSIIDLETGAQPLENEDGQVRAVINGEFYDWEPQRRNLQSRGHRFRSRTDSEILIHLYEEHGVDCLTHLRGEFAFVLWDGRRRRLFAARDRWGIKPLCYAADGRALYLASEAKGLFAAGVPAAWDHEAFFQAAHVQYVPPDRTLFRNVRQLRPGYYLLAQEGGVRTEAYWDLNYPAGDPVAETAPSEEAAIGELRDRLVEAVRLRMRADVPVACHLSGGLDSSAVLGIAASHSSRPVDCFTVSFGAEPYDELAVAEETARHVGAQLHVVPVSAANLLEHLPDAVYQSEGLAINGHLTAKYLLSRAIHEAGYRVILTGEGSDEVFAGYAHLRRDRLEERAQSCPGKTGCSQLEERNTVSAGIMLPSGESLPLEGVRRLLGWVPSFLLAKGTLGYRLQGILSDQFIREWGTQDPFEAFLAPFDLEGQLKGRGRVDQALYLWNRSALANYILRTLGDGTEMAHSVEGRLPFLDHPLFEFARDLPLQMKIRGQVEKYALREAVRPWITETVYRREKHPFLAPPVSCFSSPTLNAQIQDRLRSERFAAVPFFDAKKVRRWLDEWPRLAAGERAASDPVLMTMLCAGVLHERFHL